MQKINEKIKLIDKHLEQRAIDWPHRKKAWYLFNEEVDKLYELLKQSDNYLPVAPPQKIAHTIKNFEENSVFICGSMKSGTTLLVQLLDNHKNLFCMPGDSWFAQKYLNKDSDIETITKVWLKRFINSVGQKPYWSYGKTEKDLQNFVNYFHYYFSKNNKEVFKTAISAFYAASNTLEKEKSINYFVEKNPFNELYTNQIQTRYPTAKFIHIVREPLSNITSLNRHALIKNTKKSVLLRAFYLRFLFETALENQKKLGTSKYLIIQYEKLILQPSATMKSVCVFINVPFSETCLIPSINGISSIANSMYNNQRTQGKINTASLNKKWKKELTNNQIKIIVNTFEPIMNYMAYETWNKENLEYQNKVLKLILNLTYRIYKILIKIKGL